MGREPADAALAEAGIDGRRRAEALTLEEWKRLAAHFGWDGAGSS